MLYNSYREYLKLPEFREVCEIVHERSGGICESCKSAIATHVHHIRYCKWGEIDVSENLLDLCHDCHANEHRCRVCGQVKLKAKHIKLGVLYCDECNG